MKMLSKVHNVIESRRDSDGVVVETVNVWAITLDTGHVIEFDHDPTDDDLVAALPARPTRLEPTAAAGKTTVRGLLDEQVQDAAAWDWFAAKCAADAAFPAAAKTAAQTLADNEYQRAKRLLQAWRQAT